MLVFGATGAEAARVMAAATETQHDRGPHPWRARQTGRAGHASRGRRGRRDDGHGARLLGVTVPAGIRLRGLSPRRLAASDSPRRDGTCERLPNRPCRSSSPRTTRRSASRRASRIFWRWTIRPIAARSSSARTAPATQRLPGPAVTCRRAFASRRFTRGEASRRCSMSSFSEQPATSSSLPMRVRHSIETLSGS